MAEAPEGKNDSPRGTRRTTKTATKSPATKTPSARLGESGERLVAHHLEARGLRIVARNWHCAVGELDIIAQDGAEWVFIEVKTRRGTSLGSPEEAVTRAKQRKLLAAAQTYLMEQGQAEAPYRIDVVAVQLTTTGTLSAVRHYPRAVTEMDLEG